MASNGPQHFCWMLWNILTTEVLRDPSVIQTRAIPQNENSNQIQTFFHNWRCGKNFPGTCPPFPSNSNNLVIIKRTLWSVGTELVLLPLTSRELRLASVSVVGLQFTIMSSLRILAEELRQGTDANTSADIPKNPVSKMQATIPSTKLF
jgi:hypothetical protein